MEKTEKQIRTLILDQINELRNSDDAVLIEGLLDWYFEPEFNSVRFEDSGMAYSGDDRTACYVCQTENGEFVN